MSFRHTALMIGYQRRAPRELRRSAESTRRGNKDTSDECQESQGDHQRAPGEPRRPAEITGAQAACCVEASVAIVI